MAHRRRFRTIASRNGVLQGVTVQPIRIRESDDRISLTRTRARVMTLTSTSVEHGPRSSCLITSRFHRPGRTVVTSQIHEDFSAPCLSKSDIARCTCVAGDTMRMPEYRIRVGQRRVRGIALTLTMIEPATRTCHAVSRHVRLSQLRPCRRIPSAVLTKRPRP